MNKSLSESEFGQLFAKRFREGALSHLGYPRTSLQPEIDFIRGRPDFVCGDFTLRKSQAARIEKIADAISNESSAAVLSLLKPKAGRTPEYLAFRSGLSKSRLNSTIANLRAARLLRVEDNRGHHLIYAPRVPRPELCVFELKLEKWRRAVYQATQYRAAAHRVAIVMPSDVVRRVDSEIKQLRSLEIGLFLLDTTSGEFKTIVHPKKDKPLSSRHYYFALGKYLHSSAIAC